MARDTDSFGSHGTTVSTDYLLRRRDERRECNIRCSIDTLFGTTRCGLFNMSIGGAGIQTDSIVVLRVGQRVQFKDGPLTDIGGVVRWAGHPKYGIEFDQASKGNPNIPVFYDTLPQKR